MRDRATIISEIAVALNQIVRANPPNKKKNFITLEQAKNNKSLSINKLVYDNSIKILDLCQELLDQGDSLPTQHELNNAIKVKLEGEKAQTDTKDDVAIANSTIKVDFSKDILEAKQTYDALLNVAAVSSLHSTTNKYEKIISNLKEEEEEKDTVCELSNLCKKYQDHLDLESDDKNKHKKIAYVKNLLSTLNNDKLTPHEKLNVFKADILKIGKNHIANERDSFAHFIKKALYILTGGLYGKKRLASFATLTQNKLGACTQWQSLQMSHGAAFVKAAENVTQSITTKPGR